MYSSDEQAVLDYLKTAPNAFISPREISRRAGSKEQWEKNRRWAFPILARLVSRGVVEEDPAGCYRLVQQR